MYLLLDIGGTNLKLSLVKNIKDLKKNFKKIRTPESYQEFLTLIKEEFNSSKITKTIIGFAGMIDKKKGIILKSPNLSDYDKKFIVKDIEKILKCKTYIYNDAELAGLGESIYGTGKNYKIVAYVTLSTGIGGARIVNKEIDKNFNGFEPGHSLFLLDFSKLEFAEIEKLISGRAIENIYGLKPENIKDKEFWKHINKLFAAFLVNVSLFWSPEVIILGGSLLNSLDFEELKVNFENLKPMPIKVKLLKSKLKELSALYGAYSLVKLKNY